MDRNRKDVLTSVSERGGLDSTNYISLSTLLLLFRSVLHMHKIHSRVAIMVVEAAVIVGVFVGVVALCVVAFGVQMYAIVTGKIPQDKRYMYPHHHTLVPYII